METDPRSPGGTGWGCLVRFAFADPPYLGWGKRHYGKLHPEAAVYDTLEGHRALVDRLVSEYPDGWALSLSSTSLQAILAMCPTDVRVSPWVKPFASFKPGVNPGYCWEPVIWRGGRKRTREQPTLRDWVSCNITLRRGLTGAKPDAFSCWLFELLGMEPNDELHDLFPGSGAVTQAWEKWRTQGRLIA